MSRKPILRGEIYICDFGDPVSHSIAKIRPVIVIQNNLANQLSQLVIVTPVTSNPKVAHLPVGVTLKPGLTGLDHISFANLGHIYTIDQNMLGKKIGIVPPADMQKINEAIIISLDLR